MTEGKEGISKIEIAGAHLSPGKLVRRAEELRREDAKREEMDTTPLIKEIGLLREGMNDLTSTMQAGRLTPEQALGLAQKQTIDIAEALGKVDPETEKENWVDLEYRQEFWARFEPRSWPRFYGEAEFKERQLWDARWQLARAAFHKKITAGFPDKYRENQDLTILGKDQMEIVYRMPGVKEMMKGFAQAIVDGQEIELEDGSKKSFWEIKDASDFEAFRRALREKSLLGTTIEGLPAKEADAVAWNLIWIGNLVESADSRYSSSGRFHKLPSAVMAGEYRHVLHPQERFEDKSVSKHFWGAFGKWGVTQIQGIEKEVGFNSDKDEFWFVPAKREKDYWKYDKSNELPLDEKRRAKRGRVFIIHAPECYPVASTGSFWETSTIESLQSGKIKKETLLDYLKSGRDIPWEEVQQDAWGIYATSKFHKAFQLLEYWEPGKPMEKQKPGYAKTWADPFLELLVRLKPEARYDKKYQETVLYNLKFWAILAAHDGVKDPTKRYPTINMTTGELVQLAGALGGRRIRFFTSGEARRFATGI